MLTPTPYPFTDTPKTIAFEQAADNLGLQHLRPPLAITFGEHEPGRPPPYRTLPEAPYGNLHGAERYACVLCGECDIGCNLGAKNTLDHTYLSAAAHLGADIRPLHQVSGFRRDGDAWQVRVWRHPTPEQRAEGQPGEQVIIRVVRLVLAAGTFGSTHLLLKNRLSLPGLSRAIGTRFSGNGDLLGFLINAKEGIDRVAPPRMVVSSRGPVITSAIRVGDAVDGGSSSGRGYYIEDAGYPGFLNWLIELARVKSVLSRASRTALSVLAGRLRADGRTNISVDFARAIGKVSTSSRSLPVLNMGRDVADGHMFLDEGLLQIDWTTVTSRAYFDAMRSTMADLAREFGAEYVDNPLWRLGRVITVHPLGGAPMGRHPHEGVVDQWGRVFGAENLWVVDGAAMPGPVGANPSLTIAAFADRAIVRALETGVTTVANGRTGAIDTTTTQDSLDAAAPQRRTDLNATSVCFTEQMKGYVTLDASDPRSAAEDARVQDERFMFELTITAPDIDTFAADPAHSGTAKGYVDADVLVAGSTSSRAGSTFSCRPNDRRIAECCTGSG